MAKKVEGKLHVRVCIEVLRMTPGGKLRLVETLVRGAYALPNEEYAAKMAAEDVIASVMEHHTAQDADGHARPR